MISLCSEMWAKVCSSAFIQILSEFKISRFLQQKAVQCGDDLDKLAQIVPTIPARVA